MDSSLIRFQRPSGSREPIVYDEDIAICVNNGNWLKYGVRDEGINLKWNPDPVFEWKFIGGSAQGAVDRDQVVGLFNKTVPYEGKTVKYGTRDNGIDLVWG